MSFPTTLRLMAAMTSSRVRPLLEPVVTAAGYDLEDVTVTAAGRRSVVRVVVDRDGGVDLDAVAEVSRAVSETLDGSDDARRLAVRARGHLARCRPPADRARATGAATSGGWSGPASAPDGS